MPSAAHPVTSVLPSCTWPEVGGISPESRLVRVDLPAPLGPITACMQPRHSCTDTPLTAASPPKRRVRWCARSGQYHQHDEAAHQRLPMLVAQVLEQMQQVLESKRADHGAGKVAHAAQD